MNRLQYERSAYLLQHADNPVDWYPWGEEALNKAKQLDRPILLSVGYSTCHWCHVMERESFVDPEVAAYMNTHFINIKVDREERPDLDSLYMDAVQVLSGQSGWPLNIFLTPEQKPFYGGTYFPPENQGRRMAWFHALQFAAYNFYQNRTAVEKEANRTLRRMQANLPNDLSKQVDKPGLDQLQAYFVTLASSFDQQEGGFGDRPKFPNLVLLDFLLHYYTRTDEPQAKEHLFFSLRKMIRGGIYDQLGGGIARYAVDKAWQVPHFEKMLYDNALFIGLLADVLRLEADEELAYALEQTLDGMERDFAHPSGGYISALDADAGGQEGAFYTWSTEDVRKVLGVRAAEVQAYYQLSDNGNWEGEGNILLPRSDMQAYKDERRRLLNKRQLRMPLHRDEKIVLGWNALLVSAFAKVGLGSATSVYRQKAIELLDYLEEHLRRKDGSYSRYYIQERSSQPAFLEDYALLIRALLDVYQLNFDINYLYRAEKLLEYVLYNFSDESSGLFYFNDKKQEGVLLQRFPVEDGDLPSPNALMALSLRQLGLLLGRPEWQKQAENMEDTMQHMAQYKLLAHGQWLINHVQRTLGWREVAVVGPKAISWAQEILEHYRSGLFIIASTHAADDIPLLRARFQSNKTVVYVCQNYSCLRPVYSVFDVEKMI